jgi:hypothetical protein
MAAWIIARARFAALLLSCEAQCDPRAMTRLVFVALARIAAASPFSRHIAPKREIICLALLTFWTLVWSERLSPCR